MTIIGGGGVGGSGETNTASNAGVGGVGVYKQKVIADLEMKNINAGSNKITIVDDLVNSEIDVDVVEANLALGNIGGTLGIAKGGTGQVTKTPALDALAPGTTKGDVIVHNGVNNIREAIGVDGQVLTADSVQASGLKWAAGGGASALTTKGDMAGYDTGDARIPVGADGQVLTADAAQALGVKWAGGAVQPIFAIFKGASQTGIVTGTNTKVTWSNTVFDTTGDVDLVNNKYVVSQAGKYHFNCNIDWSPVVAAKRYRFRLYKNGVLVVTPSLNYSSSDTGSFTNIGSVILDLAVNDYIEVFAFQEQGTNGTIYGDSAGEYTFFQGYRIGA